jgi:hypothetical protein
LRAEQDVNPEGAALADEAVEEDGGVLGELVVFGEEFLEFVDDEEGAGEARVQGSGFRVQGRRWWGWY